MQPHPRQRIRQSRSPVVPVGPCSPVVDPSSSRDTEVCPLPGRSTMARSLKTGRPAHYAVEVFILYAVEVHADGLDGMATRAGRKDKAPSAGALDSRSLRQCRKALTGIGLAGFGFSDPGKGEDSTPARAPIFIEDEPRPCLLQSEVRGLRATRRERRG